MPGISLKTLHNVCFKGIPRISVTKPSTRLATNQKFLSTFLCLCLLESRCFVGVSHI